MATPARPRQLRPEDLVTVFTELLPLAGSWFDVGLALGLTQGALNAMKGPYKEPRDCLRDVLQTYLNSSPAPSWEAIAKAVAKPLVGNTAIADHIRVTQAADEQHPGQEEDMEQGDEYVDIN